MIVSSVGRTTRDALKEHVKPPEDYRHIMGLICH